MTQLYHITTHKLFVRKKGKTEKHVTSTRHVDQNDGQKKKGKAILLDSDSDFVSDEAPAGKMLFNNQ